MGILSNEEVQKRLDAYFEQKVTLIGNYINRRTPILLRCEECGHQWEASPSSVLYNDYKHRCPNCGTNKSGKYVKCSYCGKLLYRSKSQLEKSQTGYYYCNRTCGNLHKNILRAQNGDWDNTSNYRLKAFSIYPHVCAVCGWNEDERILEVHHRDENRNNNKLENLCILCPTCHRKITLGYYTLSNENILSQK